MSAARGAHPADGARRRGSRRTAKACRRWSLAVAGVRPVFAGSAGPARRRPERRAAAGARRVGEGPAARFPAVPGAPGMEVLSILQHALSARYALSVAGERARPCHPAPTLRSSAATRQRADVRPRRCSAAADGVRVPTGAIHAAVPPPEAGRRFACDAWCRTRPATARPPSPAAAGRARAGARCARRPRRPGWRAIVAFGTRARSTFPRREGMPENRDPLSRGSRAGPALSPWRTRGRGGSRHRHGASPRWPGRSTARGRCACRQPRCRRSR